MMLLAVLAGLAVFGLVCLAVFGLVCLAVACFVMLFEDGDF